MYTYTAEDVLQSLAIDSDFYETQEEWDKLDRVMELFKFVKKNAADGLINLTEEQRDVYWGTI
jgi:3-methyladenine DNA glycosylase AlkD